MVLVGMDMGEAMEMAGMSMVNWLLTRWWVLEPPHCRPGCQRTLKDRVVVAHTGAAYDNIAQVQAVSIPAAAIPL